MFPIKKKFDTMAAFLDYQNVLIWPNLGIFPTSYVFNLKSLGFKGRPQINEWRPPAECQEEALSSSLQWPTDLVTFICPCAKLTWVTTQG